MSVNPPPIITDEFNADHFSGSSNVMSIPVLNLPYIPLNGGTASGIVTGPGFIPTLRNVSCRYTFSDNLTHTLITLKPQTTTKIMIYSVLDLTELKIFLETDGTGVSFSWAPASSGDAELFRNHFTISAANLLFTAGGNALNGKSFWITSELV